MQYLGEFLLVVVTALVTYFVSQRQFADRANRSALMEIYELAVEFNHIGWQLEGHDQPRQAELRKRQSGVNETGPRGKGR